MAGPWRRDDLVERGRLAVGGRTRWHGSLVGRLLAALGAWARPTSGRVVDFLLGDRGFLKARGRWEDDSAEEPGTDFGWLKAARPRRLDGPSAVMWPAPGGPSSWLVPPLTTPSALADFLETGFRELEWLADRQGRERRSPADAPRRYTYRWVAKRSGALRLIEVPGSRLRVLQRRILAEILDKIPPHEAAHGFRRGRSVGSYVAPHVGRRVILKLDLLDFFPTISAARTVAVFLAAGYPEPVARLLCGFCTNSAPSSVWKLTTAPPRAADSLRSQRRYQEPHLPQGAPTSPALANLCAYRLDARLSGLAASAGAIYTRYADDLAFSGDRDFERTIGRFPAHVGAIALEEGFDINHRKTRIMRRGVRQRVAGVVVNERSNVPRADYDSLKAILHNCVTHGPGDQNRNGHHDFRSHLLGRIGYVASLNPARGDRLRVLFDRIAWS